jgi:hypothetical protein
MTSRRVEALDDRPGDPASGQDDESARAALCRTRAKGASVTLDRDDLQPIAELVVRELRAADPRASVAGSVDVAPLLGPPGVSIDRRDARDRGLERLKAGGPR